MDVNQTVTMNSQQNIPLYLQESPCSGDSGSKNTAEAFKVIENNNCSIHIVLLCITLVTLPLITITTVYICNNLGLDVEGDKAPSASEVIVSSIPSPLDCNLRNLFSEDWYFRSQYNPGYACALFKTVSNINIQPLQVRGHECNDTDHCYDLIRTYLGIMEGHSKFGYFIDNDANVYSGRRWFCQFWKGHIWVAVMVEGFRAASETEKERILHHFMEGVIPHEKLCVVSKPDLQLNYFEEIAI